MAAIRPCLSALSALIVASLAGCLAVAVATGVFGAVSYTENEAQRVILEPVARTFGE